MGSSCCPPARPCGSAEESSVLLKDDSKAGVLPRQTTVEGTCRPGGNDHIRKPPDEADVKVEEAAQAKQSPEVAETAPNSTLENGPLQKEVMQMATPSPSRGSELEENSATVREEDVKDRPAEGGQAELVQCTLKSLQKECAAVDWEVVSPTNAEPEEENPASENDKIPDGGSPTAEEVCPENLPERNATGEHVPVDGTHSDDDDDDEEEEHGSKVPVENAVAEPSGEFSQNNAGVSVPNARLSAGQTASSSVVSRESSRAAPILPVTQDSEDGPSPLSPQVTKSDQVSESSSGSESTGLNHSGEDRGSAYRGSAYRVPEAETTAPAGAGDSSKSDPDAEPDVERMATSSKEVTPSTEEEMMGKGQETEDGGPKVVEEEEEEEEIKGEKQRTGGDADIYEVPGGEVETPLREEEEEQEEEDSAEEGTENSEEDLYRGAEEQSAPQNNEAETTVVKVEDGGSLGPVVETLCYSEREWKGNTAKSALIRKGYKEMSRRFGGVRRVRGDNYCALRATLYQVLSHSTQLPAWLQERDVNMLWKQLEAQEGLFSQWTFPAECLQGDGTGDASLQLKGYVELLRNKWRAVVDGASAAERRLLCERVFQGGEEELGLLEALKLLMLGRAVELHGAMMGGGDVPLFCWLLFARDSSACPRSFLSNHLSHVGLGAGLEQVEMFLLGYALQRTIQVYRLYKAGTEEFVTYYPDDHKDDWPPVCLVTEDDRHYNVPVAGAAEETRAPLGAS